MSNLASKCTKSNKFFGRESLVRQFSREIIISSSFPFSISKGLSNGKMFNCTMASDFKCLLIFSKLDLSILNYFFVLWFFSVITMDVVQCESSGYVCLPKGAEFSVISSTTSSMV